jgi:hypothetical protein
MVTWREKRFAPGAIGIAVRLSALVVLLSMNKQFAPLRSIC